jgi:hypothetical protein
MTSPRFWSSSAAASARKHSAAMAAKDFFDHIDPELRTPQADYLLKVLVIVIAPRISSVATEMPFFPVMLSIIPTSSAGISFQRYIVMLELLCL